MFSLVLIVGCSPAEGTAEWHLDQGNKLVDQGRLDEAISEYDEAIRLDPQDATVYYKRGLTYYHLGQFERALKDYSKAVSLDPKFDPR
ncbi:tetratricopeptide repeat protein [Chloroflexota bacterium]